MALCGRIGALTLCGLLLAGCSGTPFGDQLARSFSSPTATPSPTPAPPAPKPATNSDTKSDAKSDTKSDAKATPVPAARPQPRAVQPSKPAPYRITIQLPSADPAAPAEAVTEALRAAGVSFEVEMIERIGAPAPTAMPPVAPPAPTITPAPAPR